MVSEKEVIKKWENGGGGVVFEINFFCLKLTKESGMEKKPHCCDKSKVFQTLLSIKIRRRKRRISKIK